MAEVHQYYFSKDSPEKPLQVIRQHIIILIANLGFGSALLVIGLIALDLVSRVAIPSYIPNGVIFGIEALYFVVTALLLYMGWFIYTRTEVIITEKHLVDVTQKTFFSRDVSQLEIARVQDVTDKREGILQTVLNYGAVIVQTAGEKDYFVLKNLPQPDKIAQEFVSLFPRWPKEVGDLEAREREGNMASQPEATPTPQPPQSVQSTERTGSASQTPAEPSPEAEDYLAD